MNKTIRKTLRFSADEYAEISSEMNRLNFSFSNYCRARILKEKKIVPQIEKDTFLQIVRIGNNLNQIAKKTNSKAITHILILEKLTEIEKNLKELL